MEPEYNIPNELKCKNELFACGKSCMIGEPLWESVLIKSGNYLIREELKRSMIVFILYGEIDVSTGGVINKRIEKGQMFLIPAGDNFHGKAVSDTLIMRCSFTLDMSLQNRFAFEQLRQYASLACRKKKHEISLLPINNLLFKELEITLEIMQTGLSCIHYHYIKKEALVIVLRHFYSKEDLVRLFAPVLGSDNDFKNQVLQTYSQVETAQELTEKLNMSPSAFKRKFKETFGISARQWLIRKKEQKVLRDILMTNMPIIELADRYNYTVNYMTAFCRKRFGKTPTELRSENV